jgi:transcriptional regulator with XRE-family HTH domain
MNKRLLHIMEFYNLSPSAFADEIGVVRSSISHIISGRNKPGVDLIQKVLGKFKDVNPYWLLLGIGEMLLDKGSKINTKDSNEFTNVNTTDFENYKPVQEKKSGQDFLRQNQNTNSNLRKEISSDDDKKIVKIVLIYSDNTFIELLPGS